MRRLTMSDVANRNFFRIPRSDRLEILVYTTPHVSYAMSTIDGRVVLNYKGNGNKEFSIAS